MNSDIFYFLFKIDVLSDPQERAWYDKHRDALLRGLTSSEGDVEGIDLFQYFSASCYKGYDNSDGGWDKKELSEISYLSIL